MAKQTHSVRSKVLESLEQSSKFCKGPDRNTFVNVVHQNVVIVEILVFWRLVQYGWRWCFHLIPVLSNQTTLLPLFNYEWRAQLNKNNLCWFEQLFVKRNCPFREGLRWLLVVDPTEKSTILVNQWARMWRELTLANCHNASMDSFSEDERNWMLEIVVKLVSAGCFFQLVIGKHHRPWSSRTDTNQ